MDLLLKAGWEMPAPQEVGCKQQMNTAGGLRAGQQPFMHVHNHAQDFWGRKLILIGTTVSFVGADSTNS